MPKLDPRVDSYIATAPEFAQPILERVRETVLATCPDAEETLKWKMPTFMYGGAILCGMAAFKQHVSFGFWKHALVMGEGVPRDGMGSYGKMTSMKDLPAKKDLVAHIKKAMRLTDEGVKTAGNVRKRGTPKPLPVPSVDFAAALKKNKKAQATFAAFPPSHQREYVEWIDEAKREETRERRVLQAIEWLAEGKPRNWKYMNC